MKKFLAIKKDLGTYPDEYVTAHIIFENFFTTCSISSMQPWRSLPKKDIELAKDAIFGAWGKQYTQHASWQPVFQKILSEAAALAVEKGIFETKEIIRSHFALFFGRGEADCEKMIEFSDAVAEIFVQHHQETV